MPLSASYLQFREQLLEMQSAARVSTLAAATLLWARNLPESAVIDMTNLVARVAAHKRIVVSTAEALKAILQVEHALQLAHY